MAISPQLGHGYEFDGNGKDTSTTAQPELYRVASNDQGLTEAILRDKESIQKALLVSGRYLEGKNQSFTLGSVVTNSRQVMITVRTIQGILDGRASAESLTLYRIQGEDGRGNVHFTAYFTPQLDARRKPDSKYQYPLYQRPGKWQGPSPTRSQIDDGQALKGRGLEIAWTSDLLENYFVHVQGSGYLSFEDGTSSLVTYSGSNGHPYTSIGKYLVSQGYVAPAEISLFSIREWFRQHPDSLKPILYRNSSYTYFTPGSSVPTGTGNMELVEGHSIAVDPKYIPFGSVLLARVPILDSLGKFVRHEFRLVMAHDRGGAIKGPGHVDLYEGTGEKALSRAGALHHYGALWLILPK